MPRQRKLTPQKEGRARQVVLLRRALLDQLRQLPTFSQLAAELDVSESCIRRIDQGLTYRRGE